MSKLNNVKEADNKIKNDDTIYTLKNLIDLAHDGYFPFKSRTTILKMVEQGLIPAHKTKIGKTYTNWWFRGRELHKWLESSLNK